METAFEISNYLFSTGVALEKTEFVMVDLCSGMFGYFLQGEDPFAISK